MFYLMLSATLLLSILISFCTVTVFSKSVKRIMERLIPEEVHLAWVRYIQFAVFVVGVSGGVKFYSLEKFLGENAKALTKEAVTLEIYRSFLGSLTSTAWVLLVFYLFAFIGYIVLRIFENKKKGIQ